MKLSKLVLVALASFAFQGYVVAQVAQVSEKNINSAGQVAAQAIVVKKSKKQRKLEQKRERLAQQNKRKNVTGHKSFVSSLTKPFFILGGAVLGYCIGPVVGVISALTIWQWQIALVEPVFWGVWGSCIVGCAYGGVKAYDKAFKDDEKPEIQVSAQI